MRCQICKHVAWLIILNWVCVLQLKYLIAELEYYRWKCYRWAGVLQVKYVIGEFHCMDTWWFRSWFASFIVFVLQNLSFSLLINLPLWLRAIFMICNVTCILIKSVWLNASFKNNQQWGCSAENIILACSLETKSVYLVSCLRTAYVNWLVVFISL